LSNQFFIREQGLPGYGALQSSTERMTKRYNLTHLAWSTRNDLIGPIDLTAGVYYLNQLDHFEDRRPKTVGVKPDEKNRTRAIGGNLRWKLRRPLLRQSLRGLLGMRTESFQPEEIFVESETGERQRRNTIVATLENDISLVGEKIRIIPSGRYERSTDYTRPFEKVRADIAHYFRGLEENSKSHSYLLGKASLVLAPHNGFTFKANYGRYTRIPSLMEVFGYRGLVVPNPGLEPETGLNRDIGVSWEKRLRDGSFLSAECVYFWSNVDKLILFMYVPFANAAQAVNIDRAEISGCELSLSCGVWQGLSLSGNMTYLRAINTGPISYAHGKRLPHRPELEGSLRLEWRRGAASVFYEFDYVSGNYWNVNNTVAPNNKGPLFPVRRIHNTGLTVPAIVPQVSFSIEAKNIGDRSYEDVMGFPLPGRSVYGTVEVEF
jgi:iron complex outermembrane receptor protein